MKKQFLILDIVDFAQHGGGYISKDWYDRRFHNLITWIHNYNEHEQKYILNNMDITKHGTIKEMHEYAIKTNYQWIEVYKNTLSRTLDTISQKHYNIQPTNTRVVCVGTNTRGCVFDRAQHWAEQGYSVEINLKMCHDYFTTGENEYEKQINALLFLQKNLDSFKFKERITITNWLTDNP